MDSQAMTSTPARAVFHFDVLIEALLRAADCS
jgi:hypothetical protein